MRTLAAVSKIHYSKIVCLFLAALLNFADILQADAGEWGNAKYCALAARDGLDMGIGIDSIVYHINRKSGAVAIGVNRTWAARSELIPEFADVVFAMQNGEVSQPIFADRGWYVIWHHGYQSDTLVNQNERNMLIAKFSYIFSIDRSYLEDNMAYANSFDDEVTIPHIADDSSGEGSDGPGIGEILLGLLIVGLLVDEELDASAASRAVIGGASPAPDPTAMITNSLFGQVGASFGVPFAAPSTSGTSQLDMLNQRNFLQSISNTSVATSPGGSVSFNNIQTGSMATYIPGQGVSVLSVPDF